MKMKELQTALRINQNKGICIQCSEGKEYKWVELGESIDAYIDSFYPNRVVCDIYGTEEESVKLLTVACINALYKSKEWEYNKLYDSLFLKYEPLFNYDRDESETIITDSTLDSSMKQGAQTNSSNGTVNLGERIDKGNSSSTSGSRTDSGESTLSVSPSDEKNTFYGKEKTDSSNTIGQQINSADSTNSLGAQNNTNSNTDNIGERNDTKKDVGNVVVDRTLKTKGNIGTLTSQEMLRSERDVAMFELIKLIAHDTVNAICSGLWDIL